ncbi:MAG: DUF427 domain-containing protein [Thermomicrobiales bacterium]|jgi:uncharacterized protein (DUF427 family)|nr:DUF427 domain-containing protein [Thermomicrobiales bacterium]
MKTPDASHPITITPAAHRVRVTHGGRVIADTRRALALKEASYPVVHYIPRDDVDMNALLRTDHTTHCPYKGDAAYYSIAIDGCASANAIWTYEAPFAAVSEIAGHLAFYPQRVDTIEVLPLTDGVASHVLNGQPPAT